MTAAFEATLCCEVKIEYSLICMIDNMGNGLQQLSYEKFKEGVHNNQQTVDRICTHLVNKLINQ